MLCENCNNSVRGEDVITVDYGNRLVCPECANEYYMCDHCEELLGEYYIAVNTDRMTLCDCCYNDHYFTCAQCNEVYHMDDAENIDGYLYCESCAEDRRGSILPYSYKPDPVFYGGNAGYGVELEIDYGEHREEAAKAISEAGKDHIYLKHDGSLTSNGMEIVTHPATLEYHVNHFPWSEICETALSYGYRSHDTDTCGLHIHASRSLFGDTILEQDLTIAKIILLIDRWYETKIVKFARRDISKMRQWADKPNAGIQPEDNDSVAVQKSKRNADDRYKAVNLCNFNTVEFRFFKGTLKRDTIIASIQWVETIVRYCRNTALKDLFSTDWYDIFGNTRHEELTSYLKQRGLYNPTLFTTEEEN